MALYERIMGYEEPRISLHHFVAAMRERKRVQMTAAQMNTAFNLSVAEQDELATLANRIVVLGLLTGDELDDVLMLGDRRIAPYDTVASVKTRLGV